MPYRSAKLGQESDVDLGRGRNSAAVDLNKFHRTSMLLLVAAGVGCVALVVHIVGLALPKWLIIDNPESPEVSSIGLWRACISGVLTECVSLGEVPGEYSLVSSGVWATRALEVLSVLTLGAAVLGVILKLTIWKQHMALSALAGIGAILAGVLCLVGCIVYASTVQPYYLSLTGHTTSHYLSLHAGFALTIVAGVGAIIAGSLAWYKSRGDHQQERLI